MVAMVLVVLVALVVGLLLIAALTVGGTDDRKGVKKGYVGGSYKGYNKTW